MSVPDIALTGTELTNAAGPHAMGGVFLLPVADTIVATARINQAGFTYPIKLLTVDTTSGWASVAPGMTVKIGSAAGLADIGTYRVGPSGTDSTHLRIGETAEGDFGLIPRDIRTGAFDDNQFITVVNRFDMHTVLPLITFSGIFEDNDQTVGTLNTTPGPIAFVKLSTTRKIVNNHIATPVDDGQTYATITFTGDFKLWPTSSSITSWAWTIPGSFTVTSGSVSSITFTARVPVAGLTNYVVKLVVTENNGNTSTRYIMVWVYDYGANIPLRLIDYNDKWGMEGGAECSFTLPETASASIPDGAMVCIVQEPTFNDTYIQTAVTQFVGWLARIVKRSEPGKLTSELEFINPAALMDMRRGTSQIWTAVSGTPGTWQEVPYSLCMLSFAQWWLLARRARGILELFDFNIASNDPFGQRLPELEQGIASIWQQQVDLADGFSKRVVGCDPDGTIWVTKHPSLDSVYPRATVIKRDTLTESLIESIEIDTEFVPRVGLIEGEAFAWDAVQPLPTPLLSLSPGYAPGQGVSDEKMDRQVTDSQDSLNGLLGCYWAKKNPATGDITYKIPNNRGALYKPARGQMIVNNIAAGYLPNGAFTSNVIVREVSRSFKVDDENGLIVETTLTCDPETYGIAGITKPVPPPTSNLAVDTSNLTSVPAYPFETPALSGDAGATSTTLAEKPGSAAAYFNGQELVIWNATLAAFLRKVIDLTTPKYTLITPPTILGSLMQIVVDPFYTNLAIPAYALESSADNALVSWNPDISNSSPSSEWVDGVSLGAPFTVIRGTNVNGAVMVYGAVTDTTPPPAPPNCLVASAFPTYGSLQAGQLVVPGETAAKSLICNGGQSGQAPGHSGAGYTYGLISFVFSSPVTITSISFRRARNNHFGGWGWWCGMYNSGGTLLQENFVFGSPGGSSFLGSPLVWVNGIVIGSMSLANVKRFDLAVCENNNFTTAHVGELVVCYT